ncbi:MAG: S-layer homology domain-containing protein, partial [Oscillospiraceae bacterium]|nr:S-layer homology domain-containing protein [Oscillospiraceae bacterium]
MRKRIVFLLIAVLLLAVSLPAALALNAAAPALTVETKTVTEGDTGVIELRLVLSDAPALKSATITGLSYDSTKLEYVGGKCNVANVQMQNIQSNGDAIFAMSDDTDINGTILTYSFRLREGTGVGEYPVSVSFVPKSKPAGGTEGVVSGISVIPGKIVVEAPHVHSYTAKVTAPTCTGRGYTTHTCTCGDSYVDTYVNALGHKWNSGAVTKPATETEPGIMTYTCTVCGMTRTETIPTLSHTHKYTAKVTAPTCTEKGFTTHTCTCGDSYADTYVDANGHKYNVNNTCTICGHKYPFTDVLINGRHKPYAEPIEWAVEKGITSGYGNGIFKPDMGCTR